MSSVVISGNTSGTITLDAPAVAGTTTLTLPATSGTVVTKDTNGIISVNGVQFPATQSPSADANCLDDYEEGTWTPAFGSIGATFTHDAGVTKGYYTKIGNSVLLMAYIKLNSATGTLTNPLFVTGQPFASRNGVSSSGVFGVEQFTIRPTLFSDSTTSSNLTIYQAGSISSMTPASMSATGYYLLAITYTTST
jgi:hypothetical protein